MSTMNATNIPAIPIGSAGNDLISAINDRLRRLSLGASVGVGPPGPAGPSGARGPAGAAGTLGVINLELHRAGVRRTLDQSLVDILRESVSVRNFGVTGDGVTDDSSAFQEAVSTTAANGQWLRIPAGFNVYIAGNSITVPSGLRLIGDGKSRSIITGNGSLVAGSGILDLNGVSDVDLIGFGIEGNVLTPVGIPYATAGDPSDSQWVNGTSIWIKSGSSRIHIEDVDISHTGGYAIYWWGYVNKLDIIRVSVRNSRPTVMGVGTDLNYFGWNGGIFGANDGGGGVRNFFTDVNIVDAFIQNCTGHCFWTRSSELPDPPTMNRNVSFTGSAEDCLGDITQPGDIDGYYEDWSAKRVGFICTNGATTGFTTPGVLVDWSPTAVRVPKWLNSGGMNIPPTAGDTTGILLNADRHFVIASVNGGAGSGDGMARSKVSFVATSAFWAIDPLINVTLCGPGGNGINYCSGFVTNNSNNLSEVGEAISIDACELNGFGYISIGGYAMRYSSITDCVIRVPFIFGQTSPIVFGCVEKGLMLAYPGTTAADYPYMRSYGNKVSGCHVEWPSAYSAAIAEDHAYGDFLAGDANWIDDSNTFSCGQLYTKDPVTNTGTGKAYFTTVTAAAQSMVGTILQSEGTLTDHSDHSFKGYRIDGVPLFSATTTTFSAPSLTINGSGCITNAWKFLGSSIAVADTQAHAILPAAVVIDYLRNVYAESINIGAFGSSPITVIDGGRNIQNVVAVTASGNISGSAYYMGSIQIIVNNADLLGDHYDIGHIRNIENSGKLTTIGNVSAGSYYMGPDQIIVNNPDPITHAPYYDVGGIRYIRATGDITTTAAIGSTLGFSVGGVPVIDSSGAYLGPLNPSVITMGSPTLPTGETHQLVVRSLGGFDYAHDKTPILGLLGTDATSAAAVQDYFPQRGMVREAAGVFCAITDPTDSNWETNAVVGAVVARNAAAHGGGSVGGSFFAAGAADNAAVWGGNFQVCDYVHDLYGPGQHWQVTMNCLELDVNVADHRTTAGGITVNIAWMNGKPDWDGFTAIRVERNVGGIAWPGGNCYWNYAFRSEDAASDVGLHLGYRAPSATYSANSQPIEFKAGHSGTGGPYNRNQIYVTEWGFMTLAPDLDANTNFVYVDKTGILFSSAYRLNKGEQPVGLTVIDNDANMFAHSFSIQPPRWTGPYQTKTLGQTCLDSHGNVQEVTIAGVGGSSEPVSWASTPGGTTADYSTVWTYRGPSLVVNYQRVADVFMLKINGVEVIDETGTWVGPAVSGGTTNLGVVQVTGNSTPTTGTGVEIVYQPGVGGYVMSIARPSGAWHQMFVDASVLMLNTQTHGVVAINTTTPFSGFALDVDGNIYARGGVLTGTLTVTSLSSFTGAITATGGVVATNSGISAVGFSINTVGGTAGNLGTGQTLNVVGTFTIASVVYTKLRFVGGLLVGYDL